MSVSDAAVRPSPLGPAPSGSQGRPGRGRPLDRLRSAEAPSTLVIALTVLCTFAPMYIVAADAARHGALFLGVTGVWPMDQLQYLAWIKDAGEHVLIRNLYGFGGGAVFVHPLFTPLGLLRTATGVSLAATLVLLQAVSVLVLIAGCRRLIRRQMGSCSPARRALALLLCLFGGLTPLVAALPRIDPLQYTTHYNDAAGALLSITALWAYAPLAIATGLMPFAIDHTSRLLSGKPDRWAGVTAAGLGLLIAWLHPWQGEELLMIAVGLAVWQWYPQRPSMTWLRAQLKERWRQRWPSPRHLKFISLVLFGLATSAPILYYAALSQFDVGWRTSARDSVAASLIPSSILATCIAPLVVSVVVAARRIKLDPDARVLVLWPVACVLTVAITPNGQYRALAGLPLPLAVLLVRAWPAVLSPARRWLAALAGMAVALAPSAPFVAGTLEHLNGPNIPQYTELAPSDVRAASLAAARADGRPILAPAALGTAIPALTDAWVWAGHPIWTPNHLRRDQQLYWLFSGSTMSAARARAFVHSTGTRVVVEPCAATASLRAELAPLGFVQTRVGCARVLVRSS